MELNADFSKRVSAHGAGMAWRASPIQGVDRRMFDRIGDEVARATTIVRYAPGSAFSPHVHTGGEEFLVLDGVFQDEHGDFPAGTYVRNPPQSSHTPASDQGCTLFVKLWQFDPDDRKQVRIDTGAAKFGPDPKGSGFGHLLLFDDHRELVSLETWPADRRFELDAPGGIELLVVKGSMMETGERFERQSWLRAPCGAALDIETGDEGATVWVKRDHLTTAPTAPSV